MVTGGGDGGRVRLVVGRNAWDARASSGQPYLPASPDCHTRDARAARARRSCAAAAWCWPRRAAEAGCLQRRRMSVCRAGNPSDGKASQPRRGEADGEVASYLALLLLPASCPPAFFDRLPSSTACAMTMSQCDICEALFAQSSAHRPGQIDAKDATRTYNYRVVYERAATHSGSGTDWRMPGERHSPRGAPDARASLSTRRTTSASQQHLTAAAISHELNAKADREILATELCRGCAAAEMLRIAAPKEPVSTLSANFNRFRLVDAVQLPPFFASSAPTLPREPVLLIS